MKDGDRSIFRSIYIPKNRNNSSTQLKIDQNYPDVFSTKQKEHFINPQLKTKNNKNSNNMNKSYVPLYKKIERSFNHSELSEISISSRQNELKDFSFEKDYTSFNKLNVSFIKTNHKRKKIKQSERKIHLKKTQYRSISSRIGDKKRIDSPERKLKKIYSAEKDYYTLGQGEYFVPINYFGKQISSECYNSYSQSCQKLKEFAMKYKDDNLWKKIELSMKKDPKKIVRNFTNLTPVIERPARKDLEKLVTDEKKEIINMEKTTISMRRFEYFHKVRARTYSITKETFKMSQHNKVNLVIRIQRFWKRIYCKIITKTVIIQALWRGYYYRKLIQYESNLFQYINIFTSIFNKKKLRVSKTLAFNKIRNNIFYKKKLIINRNLFKPYHIKRVYIRKRMIFNLYSVISKLQRLYRKWLYFKKRVIKSQYKLNPINLYKKIKSNIIFINSFIITKFLRKHQKLNRDYFMSFGRPHFQDNKSSKGILYEVSKIKLIQRKIKEFLCKKKLIKLIYSESMNNVLLPRVNNIHFLNVSVRNVKVNTIPFITKVYSKKKLFYNRVKKIMNLFKLNLHKSISGKIVAFPTHYQDKNYKCDENGSAEKGFKGSNLMNNSSLVGENKLNNYLNELEKNSVHRVTKTLTKNNELIIQSLMMFFIISSKESNIISNKILVNSIRNSESFSVIKRSKISDLSISSQHNIYFLKDLKAKIESINNIRTEVDSFSLKCKIKQSLYKEESSNTDSLNVINNNSLFKHNFWKTEQKLEVSESVIQKKKELNYERDFKTNSFSMISLKKSLIVKKGFINAFESTKMNKSIISVYFVNKLRRYISNFLGKMKERKRNSSDIFIQTKSLSYELKLIKHLQTEIRSFLLKRKIHKKPMIIAKEFIKITNYKRFQSSVILIQTKLRGFLQRVSNKIISELFYKKLQETNENSSNKQKGNELYLFKVVKIQRKWRKHFWRNKLKKSLSFTNLNSISNNESHLFIPSSEKTIEKYSFGRKPILNSFPTFINKKITSKFASKIASKVQNLLRLKFTSTELEKKRVFNKYIISNPISLYKFHKIYKKHRTKPFNLETTLSVKEIHSKFPSEKSSMIQRTFKRYIISKKNVLEKQSNYFKYKQLAPFFMTKKTFIFNKIHLRKIIVIQRKIKQFLNKKRKTFCLQNVVSLTKINKFHIKKRLLPINSEVTLKSKMIKSNVQNKYSSIIYRAFNKYLVYKKSCLRKQFNYNNLKKVGPILMTKVNKTNIAYKTQLKKIICLQKRFKQILLNNKFKMRVQNIVSIKKVQINRKYLFLLNKLQKRITAYLLSKRIEKEHISIISKKPNIDKPPLAVKINKVLPNILLSKAILIQRNIRNFLMKIDKFKNEHLLIKTKWVSKNPYSMNKQIKSITGLKMLYWLQTQIRYFLHRINMKKTVKSVRRESNFVKKFSLEKTCEFKKVYKKNLSVETISKLNELQKKISYLKNKNNSKQKKLNTPLIKDEEIKNIRPKPFVSNHVFISKKTFSNYINKNLTKIKKFIIQAKRTLRNPVSKPNIFGIILTKKIIPNQVHIMISKVQRKVKKRIEILQSFRYTREEINNAKNALIRSSTIKFQHCTITRHDDVSSQNPSNPITLANSSYKHIITTYFKDLLSEKLLEIKQSVMIKVKEKQSQHNILYNFINILSDKLIDIKESDKRLVMDRFTKCLVKDKSIAILRHYIRKHIFSDILLTLNKLYRFIRILDLIFTIKAKINIDAKKYTLRSLINHELKGDITDLKKMKLFSLFKKGANDNNLKLIQDNLSDSRPYIESRDYIYIGNEITNNICKNRLSMNIHNKYIRNKYSFNWWKTESNIDITKYDIDKEVKINPYLDEWLAHIKTPKEARILQLTNNENMEILNKEGEMKKWKDHDTDQKAIDFCMSGENSDYISNLNNPLIDQDNKHRRINLKISVEEVEIRQFNKKWSFLESQSDITGITITPDKSTKKIAVKDWDENEYFEVYDEGININHLTKKYQSNSVTMTEFFISASNKMLFWENNELLLNNLDNLSISQNHRKWRNSLDKFQGYEITIPPSKLKAFKDHELSETNNSMIEIKENRRNWWHIEKHTIINELSISPTNFKVFKDHELRESDTNWVEIKEERRGRRDILNINESNQLSILTSNLRSWKIKDLKESDNTRIEIKENRWEYRNSLNKYEYNELSISSTKLKAFKDQELRESDNARIEIIENKRHWRHIEKDINIKDLSISPSFLRAWKIKDLMKSYNNTFEIKEDRKGWRNSSNNYESYELSISALKLRTWKINDLKESDNVNLEIKENRSYWRHWRNIEKDINIIDLSISPTNLKAFKDLELSANNNMIEIKENKRIWKYIEQDTNIHEISISPSKFKTFNDHELMESYNNTVEIKENKRHWRHIEKDIYINDLSISPTKLKAFKDYELSQINSNIIVIKENKRIWRSIEKDYNMNQLTILPSKLKHFNDHELMKSYNNNVEIKENRRHWRLIEKDININELCISPTNLKAWKTKDLEESDINNIEIKESRRHWRHIEKDININELSIVPTNLKAFKDNELSETDIYNIEIKANRRYWRHIEEDININELSISPSKMKAFKDQELKESDNTRIEIKENRRNWINCLNKYKSNEISISSTKLKTFKDQELIESCNNTVEIRENRRGWRHIEKDININDLSISPTKLKGWETKDLKESYTNTVEIKENKRNWRHVEKDINRVEFSIKPFIKEKVRNIDKLDEESSIPLYIDKNSDENKIINNNNNDLKDNRIEYNDPQLKQHIETDLDKSIKIKEIDSPKLEGKIIISKERSKKMEESLISKVSDKKRNIIEDLLKDVVLIKGTNTTKEDTFRVEKELNFIRRDNQNSLNKNYNPQRNFVRNETYNLKDNGKLK